MRLGRTAEWIARRKQVMVQCASGLGVITLVGGVPLVLVATMAAPTFGEVFHVLAHPALLPHTFARPVSDGAISKIVGSVAWLAWAWLLVCITLEIAGRIRGRTAARIPGSRYIQSLVTYMVGASLALGSPVRHTAPLRLEIASASAFSPSHRLYPESAQVVRNSQPPAAPIRDDAVQLPVAVTTPAVPERLYVVRPRDTLWSIAESELGSPLSWPRIAAANYGRVQPDGAELTDDHWIRPGWLLVIPAVGDDPAVKAQAQVVPSVDSATDVEASATAPTPIALGSTVRASAPQADDEGGSQIDDLGRRIRADSTARRDQHAHRGKAVPHLPVAPIGYGLMGAGIVALLDRMRRTQQRLRPTGLRIALPKGDLAELERGLRVAADPGSADWVDLSLRLLSVTVQRGQLPIPAVSAVRLRDDVVEIVLDATDSPSLAPLPFEQGSDGSSWILSRNGQRLQELQNDPEVVGIDAPLPSLVTLGRDDIGIVMVNIERAGSVAVSGAETDPLIQAIAVEMATARWADQIDVVLVGFRHDIEGLERVSHASSLRSVVARMERRTRSAAALLTLVDRATNTETRWSEGGDAWDLCVVVCSPHASATEPEALDELIKVAGDGSFGVAVICGCDLPSARFGVRGDGGRVSIQGAGRGWSSLSRQAVPTNFAKGVAALVSVASRTDGVDPNENPYENLSLPTPERESSTRDHLLERVAGSDAGVSPAVLAVPPTIMVRVLGQVEISGAARQFTHAWAIELIVYLAMHPGGVRNEVWAAALWPDKEMAQASLHSTASAARRSLGTTASGEDHLPRSRGRLALGADVRTDWDGFVNLSRSSLPDDWQEALRLIRGRPFEGLRSPDWVVLEGVLATIEAVVVDLACRFAEHCLEQRLDARGAEWAARQGLRVSPYDERLYRVLLKAADAAGNPAGVESIMTELVHLVADDIEPYDAVHPETLALYRQLSRRSVASRNH